MMTPKDEEPEELPDDLVPVDDDNQAGENEYNNHSITGEILEDKQHNELKQELIATIRKEVFSGPIPPPEMLGQYNNAFDGCAERIVAMSENYSKHYREVEKIVAYTDAITQIGGLFCGFVIALSILAGGVYMVHSGDNMTGLGVIIGTIAGIVGTFLIYTRRNGNGKENNKK